MVILKLAQSAKQQKMDLNAKFTTKKAKIDLLTNSNKLTKIENVLKTHTSKHEIKTPKRIMTITVKNISPRIPFVPAAAGRGSPQIRDQNENPPDNNSSNDGSNEDTNTNKSTNNVCNTLSINGCIPFKFNEILSKLDDGFRQARNRENKRKTQT